MPWSLRLLVSSALLLGLAQPAAAQPVTGPADLQRLLDAVVATGGARRLGAVEDEGRTIRRVSGVGNLRTGQPPRPAQTFRAASQTKAFVATIDRITVRMLLNHTSGLFDPQVEVYQTLQDIYDLRLEHWRPGRWWPWPPTTGCCSRRARPGPTPTPTTWSPAC